MSHPDLVPDPNDPNALPYVPNQTNDPLEFVAWPVHLARVEEARKTDQDEIRQLRDALKEAIKAIDRMRERATFVAFTTRAQHHRLELLRVLANGIPEGAPE